MGGDARLFEAWRVPAWDRGGPDVATRVLPPVRVRSADAAGEPPEVLLAVPDLRPGHVHDLVGALAAARERLLDVPALDLAQTIGSVGERFLHDGDPLREAALDALPGTSGLSPEMCRRVLDGMARDWTPERLERLLRAEFADPAVLDRFVDAPRSDAPADPGPEGAGAADHGRSRLRAIAPRLSFHVSAGSVPGVSATSLVRSLLVKSPVLVKPGRGDVVLPVLMLRGLAEQDAGLAAAAAVVYWPGGAEGSAGLEDAALAGADLVVAYGGDDTIGSLRARVRPTTRLVAYHHRVSFGVIGRAALDPERVEAAAAEAAEAVAMFDQRGCVSPHVLFVEDGGGPDGPGGAARRFFDALARALARLDAELPPGRMDDREASELHQLRGTTELRAAAGEGPEVRSGGASPWTVLLEPDGDLVPSCLNRVVRVVPVGDLPLEVPERVAGLGPWLQSVGVQGVGPDARSRLAEALARLGALRIVPMARLAFPPAWWRHDGRGPLDALVRWVELE